MLTKPSHNKPRTGAINALQKEDMPVHGWYRFVLSYPPHLVRQYVSAFGLGQSDLVLDPFCGTGTTLVEARKHDIASVGCDAHPFAALVSRVKTNWALDPKSLKQFLSQILRRSEAQTVKHGLATLSLDAKLFQELAKVERNGYALTEDEEKLLPTGFLSHRPLQRLLILRDENGTTANRISRVLFRVVEFRSREWSRKLCLWPGDL